MTPTLVDEARDLLEAYHDAINVVRGAMSRHIRDPHVDMRHWPFKRIADHITQHFAEELAVLAIIEPERQQLCERNGRQ